LIGTVFLSAPITDARSLVNASAPALRSLLVIVETSLALDEPLLDRLAPVHWAAADFDAWRAAPGCVPAA
jgi:hypothetical protein